MYCNLLKCIVMRFVCCCLLDLFHPFSSPFSLVCISKRKISETEMGEASCSKLMTETKRTKTYEGKRTRESLNQPFEGQKHRMPEAQ